MPSAIVNIEKWGRMLGLRLPANITQAASLRAGQRISIEVQNGRVIITPEVPSTLSLEERLASYDLAKYGGEFMANYDKV